MLRSPEFRAYTLVASASYGGLFAFISGSSFVLTGVLGVPTEYFGYAYAFCVCGYLAGTFVCRYLLARMTVERALRTGAVLALASGHGDAGCWRLPASTTGRRSSARRSCFFLAHGINFPCGQIGSVAPFPRHAGAAAGLFGFCVMIVAA